MRAAAVAVAASLIVATSAAHAQVGLDSPALTPLGRAFARSVAKSLPVPAASGGISFEFNPKTSAFERSTEVLGQLLLERARPIGRGKLNLSLTYQYVGLDRYDGHDLDAISDRRPVLDEATGATFVVPRVDVELVTHVITPSLTYGVTDDLEVNLTVPVLYTSLDVDALARQIQSGDVQPGSSVDHAFGAGDVIVRGKYRLAHGWLGDLAVGLVFRLPSGSVDHYQGTGLFEVGPRVYASTPAVELTPLVRVQGFFDGGLDLTPENARRGEGRYGIGLDVMFASRGTLSLAFLAREPFSRLLPSDAFLVPRPDGTRSPAFGIDPGHPSYYDLSIGGRVNVWGDTVFLIGNVVVPLNDDGVRATVIPLVGIEATF
jgi:hypothetical protein